MAVSPTRINSPLKIIIDDIEPQPILDFGDYSDVIAGMVMGSHPKFCVGIYGEWGSGKSTLMSLIREKLSSDQILTVWFNAWRYEREDRYALIALLKTIAFAMSEHPIYKEVKPVILKGLRIIGKDLLRNLALKYAMTEKGIEELEKNLASEKMHLLDEVDRDTIYYDGIKKIEDEMHKISQKYPKSKVVVFIDDIDRCSPDTVLEVFESTKVFLGIDGFVYIIGLSHETISKLITAQYEKSGIKGEQYIRKIIQIPIMIPEWNKSDIRLLIKNISGKVDNKYYDIIDKNIDLIAEGVEANPREVKRFVNNFILSYEIFSRNSEIKLKELLVVQALKMRWNRFYGYFSSYDEFRQLVKRYIALSVIERRKNIKERQSNTENPPDEFDNLLSEIDNDLWILLKAEVDTIYGIRNWELYRRAVELAKDIASVEAETKVQPDWLPRAKVDMTYLGLLKSGNVLEFNNLRKKRDATYIDLTGVDLSGAILPQVDLHGAILTSAILNGADLTEANLTRANLTETSLDGAKLDKANFSHATLNWPSFVNASLNETIFDNVSLESVKVSSNFLQVKSMNGAAMWKNSIASELRSEYQKKGAVLW